jgi:hypothetical protein
VKRKPFGVWLLMNDRRPWCYDRHATLDEAMKTARALVLASQFNRGGELFAPSRVWIAAPPEIALKPSRARFRRPKP